MKVPVCEASIGEKEAANVLDAVRSGWISGYKGKYIDEFETRFADYCGAKYAVATTSCATAMLLALETLGVVAGDEVITTDFTMIATLAAIVRSRATPVLVDVEPDTWCIDPDKIEAKINRNTRVIMPVPIYGYPVDSVAIQRIAKKHGLIVIEDAAEAIGTRYSDGRMVGSTSDMTCFSFYINKLINCGEGGMLVTNSKDFADRARRLKSYDTDPDNRFVHQNLGFNYRMTNVTASIGCAQMDRIDQFTAAKRHIAEMYRERLGKLVGLTLPVEREGCVNSYWVYGVLLPPEVDRDVFIQKLADKGVETRRFFYPMHRQPALLNMGLFVNETMDYPVTSNISDHGLYLPNGVTLTDEQIDYTCDCIKMILEG